jgi:quinol monooxygenase YgiN
VNSVDATLTSRRIDMNQVGILATLRARPGKEQEIEAFLKSAIPLVQAETGTTAWFSFRTGPATYGIFDTFEDEIGRAQHIEGAVAKALFARAEELFETQPQIQAVDVVAENVQATLHSPAKQH